MLQFTKTVDKEKEIEWKKNKGLFNVYFKADRVDYGKNGYEFINLKNNPNLMSDSIYLYNLLFMNKPAFVPRNWEQHQVKKPNDSRKTNL
ncbi:hypothetical protein ACVTYA_00190 [Enterococcus hirae]